MARALLLCCVALATLAPACVDGARPLLLRRRVIQPKARARASTPLPSATVDVPRQTLVAVTVGLLGAFQFGYSMGVVNAPQEVICSSLGLSDSAWAAVVSIFGPAGLVGAQLAGGMVGRLGASGVLSRVAMLCTLGGVLQYLAGGSAARTYAFWLLMAGRVCVGLGSGLATVCVPVLLGECAPLSLRGVFGTLNQLAVVLGILAAQLLGLGLSTPAGWPMLLGGSAALGLVQLATLPLLVDSAARLVNSGSIDGARALLRKIRPATVSNRQIEDELSTLADDATTAQRGGASSAIAAARTSPAVSRALFLGVLLMLAQQLSGSNAVFYYSTSIFKNAGLSNPAVGTIVCGVVNVLSTLAGIFLIERAGRRPLLLGAMGGMGLSALVLTALLVAGPAAPASLCLLTVCVSITFFEIGLGPIPWAIGNEIFPPSCRASAMALCATVNWLATTFVALCFPLMQKALGPYSFLPFAGCLALSYVLTSARLPETKGRTIAQIQQALVG